MFPPYASPPASPTGPLADAIRARQQRLGTPDERTGDFAQLCALLHAWNNARTVDALHSTAPEADRARDAAMGAAPRPPVDAAPERRPAPTP